jgi:hypothetical protein
MDDNRSAAAWLSWPEESILKDSFLKNQFEVLCNYGIPQFSAKDDKKKKLKKKIDPDIKKPEVGRNFVPFEEFFRFVYHMPPSFSDLLWHNS